MHTDRCNHKHNNLKSFPLKLHNPRGLSSRQFSEINILKWLLLSSVIYVEVTFMLNG